MSVRSELEALVVGGELARMIGIQPAGALVQGGSNHVLGIQNARRCVGRAVLAGQGSNLTISSTSFADVGLSLDLVLSGRPLRLALSGIIAAGAGGVIVLDLLLRGTSVSGASNGVAYSTVTTAQGFSCEDIVMAPDPGPATVSVQAKRVSSNGTVFVDASNRLVLLAEEL